MRLKLFQFSTFSIVAQHWSWDVSRSTRYVGFHCEPRMRYVTFIWYVPGGESVVTLTSMLGPCTWTTSFRVIFVMLAVGIMIVPLLTSKSSIVSQSMNLPVYSPFWVVTVIVSPLSING